MSKFLPIIVLIFLVIGTFFYIRSRFDSQPASSLTSGSSPVTSEPKTANLSASSDSDRIKVLEELITQLGKKVSSSGGSGAQNTTSPMTETRIKNLETTTASLQQQIDTLKGTSSIVPTSSKKSPIYIPLGSGGTSDGRDWYSMTAYQANINSADYSGYSSMQLEVVINLSESVGEAHARLYNSSDSSAVSSASVSTSANKATLVSSSGFTVPSGNKTYVLQLQSTQGYTIYLQSARIKVNF